MTVLALFLGMSLGLAGIGGLLSGLFAHSLGRACLWATGFGLAEAILVLNTSVAGRFNILFLVIALFWAVLGWFAFGRIYTHHPTDDPSSGP